MLEKVSPDGYSKFEGPDGLVRGNDGRFLPGTKRPPNYGANKKGKTGPKRKTAKERLETIARDPKVYKALIDVVKNPDHKHWPAAVKFILEYGIGKPKEVIEHQGLPEPILFMLPPNGRERIPEAEVELIVDSPEVDEMLRKKALYPIGHNDDTNGQSTADELHQDNQTTDETA